MVAEGGQRTRRESSGAPTGSAGRADLSGRDQPLRKLKVPVGAGHMQRAPAALVAVLDPRSLLLRNPPRLPVSSDGVPVVAPMVMHLMELKSIASASSSDSHHPTRRRSRRRKRRGSFSPPPATERCRGDRSSRPPTARSHLRPPGPQINIPGRVLCVRWWAGFGVPGGARRSCAP